MPGRTLAQAFKEYFYPEKPVEERFFNPLSAKIGSHIRLSSTYPDHLFKVVEIWVWDRKINGNSHMMADYVIESDTEKLTIRVVPNVVRGKVGDPTIILLKQHWPDTDEVPSFEVFAEVITAMCDQTAILTQHAGTPEEVTYERMLNSIHSTVKIIKDLNNDGKIEISEVVEHPFTYWSFYRYANYGEGVETRYVEHLHAQLSGHYHSSGKIVGGDKDVVILKGEEVSSLDVMIY